MDNDDLTEEQPGAEDAIVVNSGSHEGMSRGDPGRRTGYVTLVGRPNAGKSSLMNALVGQKLSIVSSRAQTTWERVTGLRTEGNSQMIFLDTPGLLEVRDLHQRSMLESAHEAMREADVVLFLADATRKLGDADSDIVREALAESRAPRLVLINKIDQASESDVERLAHWATEALGATPFRISATRGDGLEELTDAIEAQLPEGPFLFPEDDLATQPVRFFVEEILRETVFEQFEQEIPWSVASKVEEFRENQDPIYIQVTLYVDRKSQKGILLGQKGHAIRELGSVARKKIETFIGARVYLDLWVKPLPGWRKKRQHLKRLGYRVSED